MSDIESSWRRWAQREESLRFILALQIHDSEFAKIFHHEGFLSTTRIDYLLAVLQNYSPEILICDLLPIRVAIYYHLSLPMSVSSLPLASIVKKIISLPACYHMKICVDSIPWSNFLAQSINHSYETE